MRRTAMKLQEVFGREPTDEELADEMGMSVSRVAQMRTAAIRPASLDAPIGDDETNNFAEVVQDENADTPYEQLEEKTVTDMLQEMVKTLDERESTILRYRFGLDGGGEKTLEEVGARFGVTRERVRQIQNIALIKLRKMIEKLEAVKSSERRPCYGLAAHDNRSMYRRRELPAPFATFPIFPKPGILFKDITPVLADARLFAGSIDRLTENLSPAPWTRWWGLTRAASFSPPPRPTSCNAVLSRCAKRASCLTTLTRKATIWNTAPTPSPFTPTPSNPAAGCCWWTICWPRAGRRRRRPTCCGVWACKSWKSLS